MGCVHYIRLVFSSEASARLAVGGLFGAGLYPNGPIIDNTYFIGYGRDYYGATDWVEKDIGPSTKFLDFIFEYSRIVPLEIVCEGSHVVSIDVVGPAYFIDINFFINGGQIMESLTADGALVGRMMSDAIVKSGVDIRRVESMSFSIQF